MKSKLMNTLTAKLKASSLIQFSIISLSIILILSVSLIMYVSSLVHGADPLLRRQILGSFMVYSLILYGFLSYAFWFIYRRLRRINDHLSQAKEVTMYALATLAETRDNETGKHLERTSKYVSIIATELQSLPKYQNYLTKDYIHDLVKSAPLHDIGKVGIRDSILLKPGKLTDEEFEQMKTHCAIGSDTLRDASEKLNFQSFLSIAIQLSRFHHEKWNGKGYPEGLEKDSIPLSARIMAIADVYDALRSTRPYKDPIAHERAKEIILAESGHHFDPEIVEAFLKNENLFKQISEEII